MPERIICRVGRSWSEADGMRGLSALQNAVEIVAADVDQFKNVGSSLHIEYPDLQAGAQRPNFLQSFDFFCVQSWVIGIVYKTLQRPLDPRLGPGRKLQERL